VSNNAHSFSQVAGPKPASGASAVALAHLTRGDLVETVLRGHLAVVSSDGVLIASQGDLDYRTFMRSSAKPLQALALVGSGASSRFDITGELLAVCCASHMGEPGHVDAVATVLSRAGVPSSALGCGIHPPMYVPAAAALWRSGAEPTALHNNCSGKHSGMLAAARALDVPLDGYLDPAHLVQQHILEGVAALCHVPPGEIVIAVDGCGAPVHGVSMIQMARAYAHFAAPETTPSPVSAENVATIAAAMTAHPWYVRGTGGPDTEMMDKTQGRLLVKGGAEGVLCVAVRGAGVGLAVKMEGGRETALHAVAIAALRSLDLIDEADLDALGDLAAPPIRNHQGRHVGHTRPVVDLHRDAPAPTH